MTNLRYGGPESYKQPWTKSDLKSVDDEVEVEQHRHDRDQAEFAKQRKYDRTREPVLGHGRDSPEPVSYIVRRHRGDKLLQL